MDQSTALPHRTHTRNKSSVKASRPRASTKGPLDAADLLASPLSPQSVASSSASQPSPLIGAGTGVGTFSSLRSSVSGSPAPSPQHGPPLAKKDFSYLLRPEIYHPLSSLSTPLPFRNSPQQPAPDTPLPELLAGGHFRAAAIAAVQALTGVGAGSGTSVGPQPDPSDHSRIFSLLYTRLACLTLIEATALAAQEVRALEDLNSAYYVDETMGTHLVPWELRVLNVRLQAMGFGDPRRAVMSYYDLAREARSRAAEATQVHDNTARELWRGRLGELGVRVAGALVEMDDLTGAAHHLSTLRDHRGGGQMAMAKALLWLHLGDVDAARACVRPGEGGEKVVAALCDMADGEFEAALERWQELRQEAGGEDDEMIGTNAAVCLLYTGRMEEGRAVLESLVDRGCSSHTLLFNLTTMYELCTDQARTWKLQLAEKVAGMENTARGWEKSNADFKL